MKLTKALKVKNQLVGEINKLKEILSRENSRRSDNLSKVNCDTIYLDLITKINDLIDLKSSISATNAGALKKENGIYFKIEEMKELKLLINFISSLPKREGEELTLIGANREKLSYQWSAYINQEKADKIINDCQTKINTIQDDIDSFNSSTDLVT